MAQTYMTKREDRAPATQAEPTYVPDIDIGEDAGRIRLLANMPGVDPGSVNVTVENNVLTVEGQAHTDAPAGYERVEQEFAVGRYRRDFTLSDAIDSAAIKARVNHGVLEVTLPKREHVKSRKIEITG